MSNDYILVDKSFQIVIAPDVYDLWLNHRQLTQKSCESFGVLIGSKSLSQEIYWLNQITEPMSKDKHTRCSFILTDKGHQAIVDEAYRDSNGRCVYFGTWHTHPQKIPIASSVDYHDWSECIARNPDRKLFFVIVGLEQLRIYFYQNGMFKFIKLKITT